MSTNARPVALVTGASSGIGRAFALALADRGHDLVLVARDTARLEALAKELGDAYGAAAEVLTADLSDPTGLAAVEARVSDPGRPIDLVVNNAGLRDRRPVRRPCRSTASSRRSSSTCSRSCGSRTRRSAAQVERGRGGVINVASIAGYQPTPGQRDLRRDEGVRAAASRRRCTRS